MYRRLTGRGGGVDGGGASPEGAYIDLLEDSEPLKGVSLQLSAPGAGPDWGFITRLRRYQATLPNVRLLGATSGARLDIKLPEAMVRPSTGDEWGLRITRGNPARPPLRPAQSAEFRFYTTAAQDQGVRVYAADAGAAGNGDDFTLRKTAGGFSATYALTGQIDRIDIGTQATASNLKGIFDVGSPPGRHIGDAGRRYVAEYFGGEDGTTAFGSLTLTQILGRTVVGDSAVVASSGGTEDSPAVDEAQAVATISEEITGTTYTATVRLPAALARGAASNEWSIRLVNGLALTESRSIWIDQANKRIILNNTLSGVRYNNLRQLFVGLGVGFENADIVSPNELVILPLAGIHDYAFVNGADEEAAAPRTPLAVRLVPGWLEIDFIATDTLAEIAAAIRATPYPAGLSLDKRMLYAPLPTPTEGSYGEPGLVVVTGSGASVLNATYTGAAIGSTTGIIWLNGIDAELFAFIVDEAAKTVTLPYAPAVDTLGEIQRLADDTQHLSGELRYATAAVSTPEAPPFVRPFGPVGGKGEDGDDAVPADLMFSDIGGEILDTQVPASFTRDAELTRAFLLSIIGLTGAQLNAIFVGAAVTGAGAARIITVTTVDGSTVVLPVPDTTAGSSGGAVGVADGVVVAVAFSADGTTLTLTLSTGATVQASVPALLRNAGLSQQAVQALIDAAEADDLNAADVAAQIATALQSYRVLAAVTSTAADRALLLADRGDTIRLTGSTARTISAPGVVPGSGAAVLVPTGWWVRLLNSSSADLTFDVGLTATVEGAGRTLVVAPGECVAVQFLGAARWAVLTNTADDERTALGDLVATGLIANAVAAPGEALIESVRWTLADPPVAGFSVQNLNNLLTGRIPPNDRVIGLWVIGLDADGRAWGKVFLPWGPSNQQESSNQTYTRLWVSSASALDVAWFADQNRLLAYGESIAIPANTAIEVRLAVAGGSASPRERIVRAGGERITAASGVLELVFPVGFDGYDNYEIVAVTRGVTVTVLRGPTDWLAEQTDADATKLGVSDDLEAGSRQWLTWTPSTRTFGRGGQSTTPAEINVRIVSARLYDSGAGGSSDGGGAGTDATARAEIATLQTEVAENTTDIARNHGIAAANIQSIQALDTALRELGDVQSVTVATAGSYSSALDTQLASQKPLVLVVAADIAGNRAGTAFSWIRGDVVWIPPRSITPELLFTLSTGPAGGVDQTARDGVAETLAAVQANLERLNDLDDQTRDIDRVVDGVSWANAPAGEAQFAYTWNLGNAAALKLLSVDPNDPFDPAAEITATNFRTSGGNVIWSTARSIPQESAILVRVRRGESGLQYRTAIGAGRNILWGYQFRGRDENFDYYFGGTSGTSGNQDVAVQKRTEEFHTAYHGGLAGRAREQVEAAIAPVLLRTQRLRPVSQWIVGLGAQTLLLEWKPVGAVANGAALGVNVSGVNVAGVTSPEAIAAGDRQGMLLAVVVVAADAGSIDSTSNTSAGHVEIQVTHDGVTDSCWMGTRPGDSKWRELAGGNPYAVRTADDDFRVALIKGAAAVNGRRLVSVPRVAILQIAKFFGVDAANPAGNNHKMIGVNLHLNAAGTELTVVKAGISLAEGELGLWFIEAIYAK